MAAVSHRDSDQRSVRVALCPTGEGRQPSQPYSESEEIQQPTVTHFQFHSIQLLSYNISSSCQIELPNGPKELESGYPHAKASVTILAPRKVSHLLVREASALIFMLSHQFFIISITNVKKRGFHLCSGVFKARLSARPSPARCTTCRLRRRSESGLACGTAPFWRFVLVAVCEVLSKWCSLMTLCVSVVFWQDYANALRVEVKGQATLRLLTDKPAIRMDNHREVRAVHIKVHPIMIYLLHSS